MQTRKLVVAAVVSRADGAILVTQRRADQPHPLAWEFPGGKVEVGEAPADALIRELREEIGVTVRAGRIWEVVYHRYPDYEVVMLVYPCRLAPGDEPRCEEVRATAWIAPRDLAAVAMLPADEPLVARLCAEGPPTMGAE